MYMYCSTDKIELLVGFLAGKFNKHFKQLVANENIHVLSQNNYVVPVCTFSPLPFPTYVISLKYYEGSLCIITE